jgi:hypothetical protein
MVWSFITQLITLVLDLLTLSFADALFVYYVPTQLVAEPARATVV